MVAMSGFLTDTTRGPEGSDLGPLGFSRPTQVRLAQSVAVGPNVRKAIGLDPIGAASASRLNAPGLAHGPGYHARSDDIPKCQGLFRSQGAL
jgi:hypothetical protein